MEIFTLEKSVQEGCVEVEFPSVISCYMQSNGLAGTTSKTCTHTHGS